VRQHWLFCFKAAVSRHTDALNNPPLAANAS